MDRWPFIVKYTLGVGVTCLGAAYLSVVFAFVHIMLDPAQDNGPIYDIIKQSFRDTTLAFIGIVIAATAYALTKHNAAKPEEPKPAEPVASVTNGE